MRRAVIDVAANAISVLVVRRVVGTKVAGVAQHVAIPIGLIGVGEPGAVVDSTAEAIPVRIIGRIVGADVT